MSYIMVDIEADGPIPGAPLHRPQPVRIFLHESRRPLQGPGARHLETKIQWCDSTVNPIMGCGGCELFPSAGELLGAVDAAVEGSTGKKFDSGKVFKALVEEGFLEAENPHVGHKQAVNVTNIWHLGERFLAHVTKLHGKPASAAAGIAIQKKITCYAAPLHLNKGANMLDREGTRGDRAKARKAHPGYAPIFESVTRFPKPAAEAQDT